MFFISISYLTQNILFYHNHFKNAILDEEGFELKNIVTIRIKNNF